jgi:hypothetical protein
MAAKMGAAKPVTQAGRGVEVVVGVGVGVRVGVADGAGVLLAAAGNTGTSVSAGWAGIEVGSGCFKAALHDEMTSERAARARDRRLVLYNVSIGKFAPRSNLLQPIYEPLRFNHRNRVCENGELITV